MFLLFIGGLLGVGSALAQQGGMPSAGAAPQSMNPDIALIADVAAAWFSADEPMQGGGHDPTANGFNLQQLELSVGKPVDPFFRFDANIVFSLYGVEIEEVYATTLGLPARTQLRAGQLLTRFGRGNPTHPHAWDFADQPFPIGRVFGGEGNRGLGVEGSILVPTPWFAELIVSETGAAGESTARSFYGADDQGVETPADLQSTVALKQFFPIGDDLSLNWGLSFAGGPNPSGRGNRSEVYGSDLYLKYRPISRGASTYASLTSEWFLRRRQLPGDVLQDLSGYTQLAWKFSQRWGLSARHEIGLPATGEDGEIAADNLDPEWTDTRQRVSAATTFWPSEFSRVRLQGSANMPGWMPVPEYAAFLTFEFAVGAHGAHAF